MNENPRPSMEGMNEITTILPDENHTGSCVVAHRSVTTSVMMSVTVNVSPGRIQKSTTRQLSANGAIRKKFPLHKPRGGKYCYMKLPN